MARAIDIQNVIEEIKSSLEIPSYGEHDKGFDHGLEYVLDLIEKAPTLTPPQADTQEAKADKDKPRPSLVQPALIRADMGVREYGCQSTINRTIGAT